MTPRTGTGQFKKLSIAERARRMRAKDPKVTNSAIAKKLGVKPQVISRVFHRETSRKRIYINADFRIKQQERLESGESADCDEICQTSISHTCECVCEGLNHGVNAL